MVVKERLCLLQYKTVSGYLVWTGSLDRPDVAQTNILCSGINDNINNKYISTAP